MMVEAVALSGLTLLVADNKAGYFGVCLTHPGRTKPYLARVSRGGKQVSLGMFATAEEAALCIARSPEGQAPAAKKAAAAPPLTNEEARQQAQAKGLTLRVADNKTGYFGVHHQPGRTKPYDAKVYRGGKTVRLGQFATAKEASLSVALEGWAVAERTSEEVLQQAQAENKTLLKAENKTGYYGVYHKPGRNKPYRAQVWRGGKDLSLGYFATAEEAALCIVRSPEGQAAAA